MPNLDQVWSLYNVHPAGFAAAWRCLRFLVCLSVCLSVSSHNSKTTRPNFTKIFVHVARGCGWFSPGGAVISYVLPVLWMTSCFMFHVRAPWRVTHNTTSTTAEIPTKFCSAIKSSEYLSWVAHWSEVCCLLLAGFVNVCTINYRISLHVFTARISNIRRRRWHDKCPGVAGA